MKRIGFVISLICVSLLTSCETKIERKGTTNSEKFSSLEINQAMNLVEKTFKKEMPNGTKLKSISYSDEYSDELLKQYSVTLKEDYQPLNLEEFIVVTTNFKTGSESEALNPNSEYFDFSWTMVKENKEWKIVGSGY